MWLIKSLNEIKKLSSFNLYSISVNHRPVKRRFYAAPALGKEFMHTPATLVAAALYHKLTARPKIFQTE
jgi:hypothetical protein